MPVALRITSYNVCYTKLLRNLAVDLRFLLAVQKHLDGGAVSDEQDAVPGPARNPGAAGQGGGAARFVAVEEHQATVAAEAEVAALGDPGRDVHAEQDAGAVGEVP